MLWTLAEPSINGFQSVVHTDDVRVAVNGDI